MARGQVKVLVAPLDWGLGHATRCVPVIREFLNCGAHVELAVVKANAAFFREVFPDVRQRLAPGYNVVYPRHGFNMGLWLIKNSGHLKAVMRYERRYANEMVERHGYDIVFSDNRFAFCADNAYNVYMTHQRRIAFPPAFSAFEGIGIKWHGDIMKKFNEVWVPDVPEFPGYAGSLSHVDLATAPVKFVGALSRFESCAPEGSGIPADAESLAAKDLNVVAVVSGVEPARTLFECKLRDALKRIPGKHVMILGKPSDSPKSWTEDNIEFHNHLATEEFAKVVNRAQWVVSRGGYSTVMDMAVLGAKCIMVPTPGQYEQVVLAQNLSKAGFAVHIPDDKLSVETLLHSFDAQVKLPAPSGVNLLKTVIADLCARFEH